jgi:hypothetical protein
VVFTVILGGWLATVACTSTPNGQAACDNDSMCNGGVCMMGKCLPRGGERTVAIDILPKLNSLSTRTSLPRVTLSTEPLDLTADERAVIKGTVTDAPDARVVLTVTSPIPGQSDLRLETLLTNSQFELGIGRMLLSSTGTLWLTPTAPAVDQPPTRFQTMLNSTLGLAFPTTSEMTPVRGTLLDSLDVPQKGYTVRAFAEQRVVSNTDTTGPGGDFQLLIAPGSLPDSPLDSVTLEFAPPEGVDAPRFVTKRIDPRGNSMYQPTVFHLPAFGTPAPLRFRVQANPSSTSADAGTQTPIALSDVSIRFRTQLLDNKDEGTGIFEREVQTVSGEVEVDLIPGTAAADRKYEVAIVPPPGSGYAALCVAEHSVTVVGNGGGQVPYSTTFTLEPQVYLTGTVVGSDGKPAGNVNVKATYIQGNTRCTSVTRSLTASSVTNADGSYMLSLDPGMYRLDVEPPEGAPWPRQTEDGERAIAIGSGSGLTKHDIKLPPGEVVIGHVRGADTIGLDGATIKIFEVVCVDDTCSAPRVSVVPQAQTTTGPGGEFRAVLPAR